MTMLRVSCACAALLLAWTSSDDLGPASVPTSSVDAVVVVGEEDGGGEERVLVVDGVVLVGRVDVLFVVEDDEDDV